MLLRYMFPERCVALWILKVRCVLLVLELLLRHAPGTHALLTMAHFRCGKVIVAKEGAPR